MDRETILGMHVNSLRDALKGLKLTTQGVKVDMQKRLLEYYGLDSSIVEEETDDVVTVVDHTEGNDDSDSIEWPVQKSMYTLKDVEDSLSTFSGTNASEVGEWVAEFKDMGSIVKWTQLQMFVYGRQLLTGAAKSYVRSQSGIRDWASLKKSLKDEFGASCSSAEVHRQLRNRRLNKSETLMEYLYSMMDLGKRLDERSIVEYFIDGIPDSKINKTVLYQADNIEGLKKQIGVYEKIRYGPRLSNRGKEVGSTVGKPKTATVEASKSEKRCFKCGDKTHLAKDCPEKQNKCFKCQKFGHRSIECPGRSAEKTVKTERDQTNMVRKGPGLIFKDIEIGGKLVTALIDTGCDVCLMRYDTLFF